MRFSTLFLTIASLTGMVFAYPADASTNGLAEPPRGNSGYAHDQYERDRRERERHDQYERERHDRDHDRRRECDRYGRDRPNWC